MGLTEGADGEKEEEEERGDKPQLTSPNLPLIIYTPPSPPKTGIPFRPSPRISIPNPTCFFPFLETLPRTDFISIYLGIGFGGGVVCSQKGRGGGEGE